MECKIRAMFFRNSFKLHLSPFEREGTKQWIGSNRSGDTLGGKREWAASMASWRSEKRAFVLSRGGGGGGGELGGWWWVPRPRAGPARRHPGA